MMQSPPAMPPSYEDFNYTADIDPNDPFFSSLLASPPNVSPFNPTFHIGAAGSTTGPSYAQGSSSSSGAVGHQHQHHHHHHHHHQPPQHHHYSQHHQHAGINGSSSSNPAFGHGGTSATLLSSPILPSPYPFGGLASLHGPGRDDSHAITHAAQHHGNPFLSLGNGGVAPAGGGGGGASLFDASEQSFLLSFLAGFDGEFNPSLPDNLPSFAEAAARVAAQGPPHPISPPSVSVRPPPKPSRTMTGSSSAHTPTAGGGAASGSPSTPTGPAGAGPRRTSGPAPPGGTGGVGSSRRELLTDSEKRQNHILSEQRRRNYIREGFKELVELLELGRKAGAKGLGLGAAKGTGVEEELWAAAIANGTAGEGAFEDEELENGHANGVNGHADGEDDEDELEEIAENGDGDGLTSTPGSTSRKRSAGADGDSDRPRSRARGLSKDGASASKLVWSKSGKRAGPAAASGGVNGTGATAAKANGKAGAAPPLPLDALGGKGKGRGRGGSAGGGAGSKSAVLFQAVDLIRWLNARNEDLEAQCNALESFKAARAAQMNPHLVGRGGGGDGGGGGGGGGGGAGGDVGDAATAFAGGEHFVKLEDGS